MQRQPLYRLRVIATFLAAALARILPGGQVLLLERSLSPFRVRGDWVAVR